MSNPGPEVPEADAIEQAQPIVADEGASPTSALPKVAFEVPEADALEQAYDVPEDEDWR